MSIQIKILIVQVHCMQMRSNFTAGRGSPPVVALNLAAAYVLNFNAALRVLSVA
jgi:hypothetical protein